MGARVIDRLVGGVGLRRGRRDPDTLQVGDALDWWRVEECVGPAAGDGEARAALDLEPGESLLRLRAEMKAPGRAWLELRVAPDGDGSVYRQRAVFLPSGLSGHAYWWAIAPFHVLVFGGMVRRIVAAAELTGARDTVTGVEHRGPIARRRFRRATRDAERARRRVGV